eukprot:6201439-Pleurochrysis_carterae.AAC.2
MKPDRSQDNRTQDWLQLAPGQAPDINTSTDAQHTGIHLAVHKPAFVPMVPAWGETSRNDAKYKCKQN